MGARQDAEPTVSKDQPGQALPADMEEEGQIEPEKAETGLGKGAFQSLL